MEENLFQRMLMNYNWKKIPGCPGRYVLRGGLSSLSPADLLNHRKGMTEEVFEGAADPVLYCRFSGGGLISFKKTEGYIHTLCDSEGFERRMRTLRGGVASLNGELKSREEKYMEIYLVQHGIAKSKEADPERGLTLTGEKESIKIGKILGGRISEPLEIWHSGKKRAEETAGIIGIELGITSTVRKHENLAPSDDIKPVLNELSNITENTMIVGHLPYLPKLLAALLGLKEDQCPVAFRNSAVLCLRKDEEIFRIHWILSPDLL